MLIGTRIPSSGLRQSLVHFPVYQLEIITHFSAAHAITMNGVVEPLHGHDWRVTAVIEGPELNADGRYKAPSGSQFVEYPGGCAGR